MTNNLNLEDQELRYSTSSENVSGNSSDDYSSISSYFDSNEPLEIHRNNGRSRGKGFFGSRKSVFLLLLVFTAFLTFVILLFIGFIFTAVAFVSPSKMAYHFGNEDGSSSSSSFGLKEFECHGNCYCDKNARRIAAPLATNSRSLVFTLFSATSLFHAINYFKKEKGIESCKNKYNDCPEESIIFDEDSVVCESINNDKDFEQYREQYIEKVQEIGVKSEEEYQRIPKSKYEGSYECKGHCLPEPEFEKKYLDEAGCEEYSTGARIDLLREYANVLPRLKEVMEFEAKLKFEKTVLRNFCFGKGKIESFKPGKNENQCISVLVEFDAVNIRNKYDFSHIECKKVSLNRIDL